MLNKTESAARDISILMPIIAKRILLEFFQSVNIPQSQLLTLMSLYTKGACRLSELSSDLHVSAPTASGLVDRLESSGYVKRCADKEDRRAINIELTSKGTKLAKQFRKTIKNRWQEVLTKITIKDQQNFVTILKKIEEAIQ